MLRIQESLWINIDAVDSIRINDGNIEIKVEKFALPFKVEEKYVEIVCSTFCMPYSEVLVQMEKQANALRDQEKTKRVRGS